MKVAFKKRRARVSFSVKFESKVGRPTDRRGDAIPGNIKKYGPPPHSQDTTKTPSSQRVQRVRCGCISVQFANEAKNENKRATFGWRRRVFLPPPRRRRTIVFHGVFSKGDTNDYAAAAAAVPFRRTPHATGLRLLVSTSRFRRAGVVGGGMVLRRFARGIRGWRGWEHAQRRRTTRQKGSAAAAAARLSTKHRVVFPNRYLPRVFVVFRFSTIVRNNIMMTVRVYSLTHTHATCQYYSKLSECNFS